MKNKILVSLCLLLSAISLIDAQTTAIPDTIFEDYLETHDANGSIVPIGDDNSMGDGIDANGLVFTDRISTVLTLSLNNLGIGNLSGIEDFTDLENLICNGNNLATLNVTSNVNLKSLLCNSNQLQDLNIAANTELEDLDCSGNQLTTLNVAANSKLTSITCSDNRLTAIDISGNIDLESLAVSSNLINNLNVSGNTNLKDLFCASNRLTLLDLSLNNNLETLDVSNNQIVTLDLSSINTVACPDPQTDPVTVCQGASSINVSNNRLTSLIVANGFNDLITSFTSEGNPDLSCIQVDTGFTPDANWTKDDWTYYGETTCANIYTYVPDDNFEQELLNQGLDDVLDNLVLTDNIDGITDLDVSNTNPSIEDLTGIEDFIGLLTLNCSTNAIEEINLSNNTSLTSLDVSGNSLASLDITNLTGLITLNISDNSLDELDLSANLSIENLNCSNNTIQSLDLRANVNLTDFDCAFNALQALNIQNGQNGNLSNFDATNNPDLTCILADANTIPGGVNWAIGSASLNTNCGTYVPDDGFEQAIIDAGFDVGPLDNYVPTANIENETNLDVSNYNIVDLTGIQDFTDLQTFNCSSNTIVELNLSANTALISITCNNNNSLEFVDIRNGNNASITVFNATDNPNLFCINVDAAVIGNIPAGWTIDATANYNNDCENNRYTPIPDDNFEQALIDLGIDAGVPDNQVLTANIEYLTSLNVSGENIESLEGIKAFLSLRVLDCSNNYLDELDVSGMLNLEELYCGSNYFLTNNLANVNGVLNTTGTASLTKLFCPDNSLADIDISLNTNLEILDCSNNEIVALDISGNNSLIEVNCDNNQISNFTSYGANNSTLTNISCNNNELVILQVDRCLALTTLNCRSNSLNSLDISSNAVLEVLDFSDNELANVDLSANTNLIAILASQNQLTEIDDLASTVLESLILDDNEITQLSTVLDGLTSIKYLSLNNNQLTELDVSSNINLIELKVINNELTSLQLATNLNQLKTLNCNGNSITGDLDLTTMGTVACPAQNEDNPLDFCPETIVINVSDNQLDFVNIQNGINTDISNFSATNNPDLTCIQVDDADNISAGWTKDVTSEYSIDCRFGETYVPDDNFEQALITLGYDVGPLDDYVPTVNIQVIATLDISGNSISDLTGIEDFEALQNFNCSNNTIDTIDVSKNINLVDIDCSNNNLESLDLTNNLNITSVNIANNSFTEFDVSLSLLLEVFNCDGNNIVELDFSINTALANLNCTSNALEVLNLQNGQNPNLLNLNAQNNADLTCIQTDDGAAPAGVTWLKDATTNYSINCRFGETYVPDDNFEQALIDFGIDTAPLDDYVPTMNIQNRTSLNVAGKEISDLTGIEDFENLVNLNFENNTIAAVDLSNNLLLESIDASGNELSDLDISNLVELRVLDISENNFTQLDFSNNLVLANLNISENDFSIVDVSLLLDLEGLNCASNQLTELDVTLNSKLIELICSSNLFFQDKLNIQNGVNQFLTVFNASDNPDLTCILVDDPVAVISNVDGTYDDWFKDPTATYQTVCDDADNDGVANEDDLCPGTPFGEPVDLFGCTFSPLPEDNFTILITGETCLNNNDGKINITTKEFYEYKAHLVGDDFDREYTFTKEIDILNLLAGTYRLCITSDEIPNFQRCFDIIINHPENLDVITGKRKNGKEVTVNMSGSSSYNIEFNGLKFTTSESQLTLQLEHGKNTIKISTDLPCQGEHEESILLSNNMFVHPNPFHNELNLYLGEMDSASVQVSIYSTIGQMLFLKEFDVEDKRSISINTSYFNTGLYTVFIQSNNSISNFKIVKK